MSKKSASEKTKPRKVALVNVHDYKDARAYWEIRVLGNDDDGYEWGVRIYDRKSSREIESAIDVALTRDEADTAAQKWVIEAMKKYRN